MNEKDIIEECKKFRTEDIVRKRLLGLLEPFLKETRIAEWDLNDIKLERYEQQRYF